MYLASSTIGKKEQDCISPFLVLEIFASCNPHGRYNDGWSMRGYFRAFRFKFLKKKNHGTSLVITVDMYIQNDLYRSCLCINVCVRAWDPIRRPAPPVPPARAMKVKATKKDERVRLEE
ncbi:hypothetical protein Naga_102290g2 [Nannochloropsis gaditana]|uniref:Uncharacterized protein n=1 Tax=Nannochloropsis gaditana TaxID=72520 RepID=W7TAP8_9STRA|nr:hypothetical protein Naga_102290g2 [Nannochloropsis gaditana]